MSFPAYSEYKDSGVEWLGEVPAHWKIAKLKWFASVYSGDGGKSGAGEYALFGANGVIGSSNTPTHHEARTLVGRVGSAGAVNYANGVYAVSDNSLILESSADIMPRYSYYWAVLQDFTIDVSVTAQPLLTASQVKDRLVALPVIEEQAIIVSFLDHETARIDALIAEQQRLITLLKEKRQAVISHAVTKGLDPDAPMKDSDVEWLGEVPAHWVVLSLRRVTDFIQTGSTPSTYQPSKEIEGGIDWFTPGDFEESLVLGSSKRKVKFSPETSEEVKFFPSGSVYIVGIGATLGKVGYATQAASANQQMNVLVPSSRIDGYFLAYSMSEKKEAMKIASNASTIGIMNQDKTKGLIIAVPPKEEQKGIVDYLDKVIARNNELIRQAKQGVSLFQERRSALISAAVTGKIDVRGRQAEKQAEPEDTLMAAEPRATYQ